MALRIMALLVIGVAALWLCPAPSADVPRMINYQAQLTNAAGAPLNGTFDMTFRIYPDILTPPDQADWSETHLQVNVRRGLLSILLGGDTPIPASVFDGSVKYFGLQVESDPEMTPRRPIATTGYAFRSLEADQAANADSLDGLEGSDFVQTAGDQTIDGIKTFSSIPVLPAEEPTSDNQVTRKLYVDAQDADRVLIPSGSTQGDILYYNGSIWTRLPAGVSGQYLKTQGQNLNPVWSELVLPDNSVSQAKLKTATGEVSGTANETLELPGGEYCFSIQGKASIAGTSSWYHYGNGDWAHEHVGPMGTSYKTLVCVSAVGGPTVYVRARYVTSSGKNHWLFFLLDKETKQILAGYQAPDHPCYGSGGDENDTPHPFDSYDPEKHKVILIDNDILPELKAKVTSRRSLLTIINEEYEIDFDSRPVYQPREIIEIDEYGDKEGEILQTMKTPEWAKILIGKDEMYLKRRLVRTLPSYISYKRLKPKSDAIPEYPVLSQRDR